MTVNFIKKFQEGGQVEQGQPQGGGAEEQIAQMAQQIIQQLRPEGAAMLAQMIMQMLEGAAQQVGAVQPQGPPVYKRGGKMGGKGLILIGRK